MPSPISRRPGGLLDLLLTQQQGKNPANLLDDVAPTFDMLPFYAQERLSVIREALAVTASGPQATTIDVPAGETWIVYNFGLKIEFATAAQSCNAYIDMQSSAVRATLADMNPNQDTFNPDFANEDMFTAFWLPQVMVFPSGTSFVLDIQRLSLDGQPNLLMQFGCIYTRMET